MSERLERTIFYLLIFTIPVQARVILHSWTRPFNQWTSAYLYGTDIFLVLLLIFWLARSLKINNGPISNFQFPISSKFSILKSSNLWLLSFLIISAISVFNSRIIGLSFYQLLKLAEFIGFYFYLQHNFGKVFQFRTVLAVIIASGFFQSIIAIVQYAKQGSIGLRLLGESPLSVNTTGMAVFMADGEKYLRAYGTATHPNILAAWLFVAIFAFYYWFLYYHTAQDRRFHDVPKLFIYPVLLFGFFFTFSRVIIGLWVLGVLATFVIVFLKREFRENKILKRKMFILFSVSVAAALLFSVIFWPQVNSRIHVSAQEEAVTQRVFYNKIAGSTALSNPLLGVGIGQFVLNLMYKFKHLPSVAYQPVHNIYLLIVSETGFIGFGTLMLFIFYIFYNFIHHADFTKLRTVFFLIFALSFIVIGIFDHFLLTSQQGSLAFWLVLAFITANGDKN
ncbi:MAG: O-antigen ligase family protein [Candidatus Yanofskybacteria bacterium]|nr:O-antigen ligase family protein [Candidatus Yanofskybacteria bacterium]